MAKRQTELETLPNDPDVLCRKMGDNEIAITGLMNQIHSLREKNTMIRHKLWSLASLVKDEVAKVIGELEAARNKATK